MDGKMPFDLNNQLSPTEPPAVYHQRPVSREKEEELTEAMTEDPKEEAKVLTKPTPAMFAQHGAPRGWLGNFTRRQDDEANPCFCSKCHQRVFPELEEGPTHQVHPAYPTDAPQMGHLVGLYDYVRVKIEIPCAECRLPIKLDGKTAVRFDPEVEEAIHVECLDTDRRAGLKQIGFRLPHLIIQKEVGDGVQAGEDTEDRDGDGGPSSGDDGGDEQAGGGAEQQHRHGVQSGRPVDENPG